MRDYMDQPISPFSAPPPQVYDSQNPKYYPQNGYYGPSRSQFEQFARQWHKLRSQNSRRVRHASPTPNAAYRPQTPQQRYSEQYYANGQYPPANYQNVQYVYPPQKQLPKYHKARTPGPSQLQASQEAAFAARQQYLAYAQHYPHLYDPRMYQEWRKMYRNQQQYRQGQTPKGGAEAVPFNTTDSFGITPDPGAKRDESAKDVAARHAYRYERMKGLDPRLANGSAYKGSRKQMASRGSGADEVQYFKVRDQGVGVVKREVVSGEGQSSSELHPDDSAVEPPSESNQILPPDFREAFEETCKELLAMHVAFENVVDTPEEGSSKGKEQIIVPQDVKQTQHSVLNPNLLTTRNSSFEIQQAASAQSKLVTKQTMFVKGTKADRAYFSKTPYMRRSQDHRAKSVRVKEGPKELQERKSNRQSEENSNREPTKVMGWLTATS